MENEAIFISELINPRLRDRAFKKLLDLYQERLYWHIRKIVITHENSDDVLQNTFLRIYKSLPKFKQNSSLNTWMYRIAYNESLRFLDQNKLQYKFSIDDINNNYMNCLTADTHFQGDEIQERLHQILSDLPDRERQIFHMKYYDDLKFREIASILNIKDGTLKSSYYNTVRLIEKKVVEVELLTKSRV